jgi:hypothetical protein
MKIILLITTLLLISYLLYLESNNGSNQNNENMENVNYINDTNYTNNTNYSNIIDTDKNQQCKSTKSCNVNVCGNHDLYPILNPKFNMREVAKQCLLLEDHLNNKNKRCIDCIKKHMLIIDGLLEEAVSLEQNNRERDLYRSKHKEWVLIEKEYSNNSNDNNTLDNISKQIRLFRKPLVYDYFDMVSEYSI